MTKTPRIAVITGSARTTRWSHIPAEWISARLNADGRMQAEILDLRDFDLPFFDEPASNLWMPSSDPRAVKWQETLAGFDGFVFVVAEYNHSISGVLKNALDQAYKEWNRKPAAMVGYGGVGAARAIEHLRGIAVELQMVSTRNAVHIAAGAFMEVHPLGGKNKPLSEIEPMIGGAADAMIEELFWWTEATREARAKTA